MLKFEVISTKKQCIHPLWVWHSKDQLIRGLALSAVVSGLLFGSLSSSVFAASKADTPQTSISNTNAPHKANTSTAPTSEEVPQTGWVRDNKGLYYRLEDGSKAYSTWIKTDKGYRYVTNDGYCARGWLWMPNGKWFYFNKDTYQMVTGKLTDDNKDYWLDENAGLLYDAWVQDSQGNWLHTDDNGVLATGWFKTKSGYWFYFNQDHTMKTGILTDKGYTFWLDKNDGLLYNEWVKDESGKWLRTDGNGCLVKGWYHAPNGKWFYFNKDNYKMVTGKLTDDNKDYWLDENAGLLYDAWVQDAKGNWLHTDDNGVLATGWFKTKSGYWFYFNQDHTMKTGILTDKGYTFWLDKNDGLLYNEWVKDESGKWLRTDGNGCLVKGWYHAPNGKWFYFNKDNYQMVTGKLTDDNKDYWLDEDAGLLYDAWVQVSQNSWMHTDSNGVLVKGWYTISNGKRFYFDPQDLLTRFKKVAVDNHFYWIDQDAGLLYNTIVSDGNSKFLIDENGQVQGQITDDVFIASDGSTPTGLISACGKNFYVDPHSKKLRKGTFTVNDLHFYANDDYVLLDHTEEINGKLYAYSKLGTPCSGWLYSNDAWYYAADASGLCATGWQKVNGVYYYLDPTTYQMQTGWLTDPTGVFYLESNGAMLASCDKTIDGYVYRFDSNGRCDKVGYQNPAGYFRVSSWNVPSVWGAPYPFNYMTPSRIGVNASRQECIDAFLSRAKEYIGTPYVWDYACAPGVGTDCVGLVMQCAYACGMDLGEFNPYDHWATGPYGWHSHDANNLYNSGMYQSINLADRQPGDLIFWRGHVAIYCGGDWIIEAYPPDVHWSHLYDHGAPIGCGRIFI